MTYDAVSTGAGDDLAKGTEIARSMVVRFGMDKEVGQLSYEAEAHSMLDMPGGGWQPRQYGEATAGAIDAAVRALTDQAFQAAVNILAANRALLEDAAQELLVKETFSAKDLAVMADRLAGKAAPKLVAGRIAPASA